MFKKMWVTAVIIFGTIAIANETFALINPGVQVEKFLMAVQKRDSNTIIDLTYYYQTELSGIKSKNPKTLWPKLTAEYYEAKSNILFTEKKESITDAWVRLGGAMFNTSTDPSEYIRALSNLLGPSCTWKITETRKEKQHDAWSGREFDAYLVYVSLSYKSVNESPLVGSQFLKEGIMAFVTDSTTGLYMRSDRIAKGDSYWGGDPKTDLQIAQRLLTYGLLDDSINLLESLQKRGVLNGEGKDVLASTYFERVKRNGIKEHGGGSYGLSENYNWRQDIERAIALYPATRTNWINFLSNLMQINLKSEFARYSGGDEQVVYVAKVATEYSRGYQELEILIHGPMLALANIYVNRAQHEPNHSDYFITKYLITALSLLPDDMSIKQATIEIIKTWVVRFFKNRPDAPSPAFVGADKSLVNILEYFDSLKMDLEPNDMPLFSRAAYRLAYYYKNAMMVDKGRVPYWEQKAKEWHEKNPVEYFTVADWMNKGYEAYRNKKYDDAVDAYRKAIALDSGFIDAYYNLACIYSLRGDQSAACDWLAEAIDKGYKNWGNIERDRDLNNIRNSECYKRIREKR